MGQSRIYQPSGGAGGAGGGALSVHGSFLAPIVISTPIFTPVAGLTEHRQLWYVVSDAGERPISIAAGTVIGQELEIICCSIVNFISILEVGTGTDQNGDWSGQLITKTSSILYRWNGVAWYEIGRR